MFVEASLKKVYKLGKIRRMDKKSKNFSEKQIIDNRKKTRSELEELKVNNLD